MPLYCVDPSVVLRTRFTFSWLSCASVSRPHGSTPSNFNSLGRGGIATVGVGLARAPLDVWPADSDGDSAGLACPASLPVHPATAANTASANSTWPLDTRHHGPCP